MPCGNATRQSTLVRSCRHQVRLTTSTPPLLVHYNICMHAYARVGELRKCLKLLRAMRAAGIAPDLVSYNTLIACAGKTRMPQKVPRPHRRGRRGPIAADSTCAAPTAYRLCTASPGAMWPGQVAEAVALIDAAGLTPDYHTFAARARAYLECGKLDELRALMDEGARRRPPFVPSHALNKARWPDPGARVECVPSRARASVPRAYRRGGGRLAGDARDARAREQRRLGR